jgi:hypothetical protein
MRPFLVPQEPQTPEAVAVELQTIVEEMTFQFHQAAMAGLELFFSLTKLFLTPQLY